jgi:hypothetical protein
MEIKNEHRKLSLAMVVALDRSGSMSMPVGDGRTKMDLANLGTCAAIDALSPFDEVGVIAVDSAAHVVSPLVSADDTQGICNTVRGVQSMGGGIFVYTALVQAGDMIQASNKGTRHIILFADAADAEEPGNYVRFLETMHDLDITVSVIGLGSELDSDADFLKDCCETRRRTHPVYCGRRRAAAIVRPGSHHRGAVQFRRCTDPRRTPLPT